MGFGEESLLVLVVLLCIESVWCNEWRRERLELLVLLLLLPIPWLLAIPMVMEDILGIAVGMRILSRVWVC